MTKDNMPMVQYPVGHERAGKQARLDAVLSGLVIQWSNTNWQLHDQMAEENLLADLDSLSDEAQARIRQLARYIDGFSDALTFSINQLNDLLEQMEQANTPTKEDF